eukprot:CAMPEP_0168381766 /NCGR_PEP_ID=MMETSP0228-20121227/13045_1 /TAXON_ID=133427 /ORGANISM="Protoceratium reticulatum, Strain CCCM 535 (=CCMP 1889)" /LENGTH=531 /DNA_ID=CAMNT_0008394873 /DNA_START=41 /DNA_END=1638 /DNA_ORIENTATION=+
MSPTGSLHVLCRKTKLCRFYTAGACTRGSACNFAHGGAELNSTPDLHHTKLCPSVSQGRQCEDSQCAFAHSPCQLRRLPVSELAAEARRAQSRGGASAAALGTQLPAGIMGGQVSAFRCEDAATTAIALASLEEETRLTSGQPAGNKFHKTRVCAYWSLGKCRKKGSCNFAHGAEELQPQPDLAPDGGLAQALCDAHGPGYVSLAELSTGARSPGEAAAEAALDRAGATDPAQAAGAADAAAWALHAAGLQAGSGPPLAGVRLLREEHLFGPRWGEVTAAFPAKTGKLPGSHEAEEDELEEVFGTEGAVPTVGQLLAGAVGNNQMLLAPSAAVLDSDRNLHHGTGSFEDGRSSFGSNSEEGEPEDPISPASVFASSWPVPFNVSGDLPDFQDWKGLGHSPFSRQHSSTVSTAASEFGRMTSSDSAFSWASCPPSSPPEGPEEPRQERQIRNKFHKTKQCRFFELGKCRKRGACNFAHSPEELRPMPDLTCTKLCPHLLETGECTQSGCTFAHSAEEFRGGATAVPGPVPGA